MSLPEFNSLMTHKIKLRKRIRNASGDFSDISNTEMFGFCQYGNKLVTLKTGEQVTSTAIVFLKDDCGIDINYTYWMVDQIAPYSRINMEVLQIDPIDDPQSGNTHHFELIVR